MANNKHRTDHIIDDVFYCGVNNVITVAGIVGNVILLVIFMRPHLIRHRSILHTYLKVCHFLGIRKAMRDALGIFDTQAISVADLLWLIYIFVYNLCTCVRLSDPPREVFGVLRNCSLCFFYKGTILYQICKIGTS